MERWWKKRWTILSTRSVSYSISVKIISRWMTQRPPCTAARGQSECRHSENGQTQRTPPSCQADLTCSAGTGCRSTAERSPVWVRSHWGRSVPVLALWLSCEPRCGSEQEIDICCFLTCKWQFTDLLFSIFVTGLYQLNLSLSHFYI